MLEQKTIVINTGPLIALIAALGNLKVLAYLYHKVYVPYEVCWEILAGGPEGMGVQEFNEADWLVKNKTPLAITSLLKNLLDSGEAAVIQLALDERIQTVCIDETVGRRVANLSGLLVTGSIGILIKAKKSGYAFSFSDAIEKMQTKGIRLSTELIESAISLLE